MSKPRADVVPAAPAWRRAADDAVRHFDYGDVIPRRWLEQSFGIEFPETGTKRDFETAGVRFFAAMAAFRNEVLVEHKWALKSIGGGDYMIVLPRDQGDYAVEFAHDKVDRLLDKARQIIEHTRTELLDANERRTHSDRAGKLAAFQAMTRQALTADAPREALPPPTRGLPPSPEMDSKKRSRRAKGK